MYRMKTDKKTGKTVITFIKKEKMHVFDSLHDALMYIWIMKDVYCYPRHRRQATEPFPVRSLNPGKYPIRIEA